MSLYCFRNYK